MHQRPRRLRPREPVAALTRAHRGVHVASRPHVCRSTAWPAAMKFLTALIAGTLFGAGLLVSGMTDPANVLGFLDVFGEWRPQLALVMVGGAIAAAPAFFFV